MVRNQSSGEQHKATTDKAKKHAMEWTAGSKCRHGFLFYQISRSVETASFPGCFPAFWRYTAFTGNRICISLRIYHTEDAFQSVFHV